MTAMPVDGAGLDIIAGVHQTQADPPVDRRHDVGVGQVQRLGVDLGLVGAHRALILRDDEFLVLRGLGGDRILLQQRIVTGLVEPGLIEQALVMGELALVLRLQRLIGAGIDLGKEFALLDMLALGEGDLLEIAGNLADHGHGGERRHRAERVDGHIEVARGDGADGDRRLAADIGALACSLPVLATDGRFRRGPVIMEPGPACAEREQDQARSSEFLAARRPRFWPAPFSPRALLARALLLAGASRSNRAIRRPRVGKW